MSGILLREADSLVEVTRLLDEESWMGKQALKAPSPWVVATKLKDGGGMPKAQLTQNWVDAMNQTDEERNGAPWHELTKHLSSSWLFMHKFV